MLKTLTTQWHWMRIARLILGIMLIVQAIQLRQYLFVFLGLLLAVMALANIGCSGGCVTGACNVPPVRETHNKKNDHEQFSEK